MFRPTRRPVDSGRAHDPLEDLPQTGPYASVDLDGIKPRRRQRFSEFDDQAIGGAASRGDERRAAGGKRGERAFDCRLDFRVPKSLVQACRGVERISSNPFAAAQSVWAAVTPEIDPETATIWDSLEAGSGLTGRSNRPAASPMRHERIFNTL